RWMRRAKAGFTSYPVHCLGKSGVFAAYAAHGLLPIVARTGGNDDGLVLGRTMVAATGLSEQLSLEDMAEIAAGAHTWYRPHSVEASGSAYYDHFANATEPSLAR